MASQIVHETPVDGVWDLAVIGAGPAGLACATEVLSRVKTAQVTIIEAGEVVSVREEKRYTPSESGRIVTSGVGGAGLFSDGKLCLSLEVGGSLPPGVSRLRRRELLARVRNLFGLGEDIEQAAAVAAHLDGSDELGLDQVRYPVFHIGTDHCASYISELTSAIERKGGVITPRSTVIDLAVDDTHMFDLTVESDGATHVVRARNILLALGKVGANRQAKLCNRLGLRLDAVPMQVGVRLEADSESLRHFFRAGIDPKFKLSFPDGTRFKTHCGAAGGSVLALDYGGLPLAGGQSCQGAGGSRSSVALLWNGIRTGPHAYDDALAIMRRCASVSGGGLLAQRVTDYLNNRKSTGAHVHSCQPTVERWSAGDLREALPDELTTHLTMFLERLSHLDAGFVDHTAVMFAPAIEWWSERADTDAHMQTRIPGLFVAGDGAGWSQGIVQAAATGILAGEGIARALDNMRPSGVRMCSGL